jgi:L-ascorbate metabolism protein UlaG (beta-lactamase superfamily)
MSGDRRRRAADLVTALRALAAALFVSLVGAAGAEASGCFPTAGLGARVLPAAIPAGATVQLTFLGHSSFLIETREGVTVVTDYNGYIRAPVTPTVVTMNNAHDTHFTDLVEPGVEHVLRGWNPAGGPAEHDITVEDLRVRNVPTAVHGRHGDQALSNSIFVFETEDLCIAHLGHLHHRLLDGQLGELGQIDVLLVPIDGAYTMSQPEMVEVIGQIGPAVVVPMHYFGAERLARFLDLMGPGWQVAFAESPALPLSRSTLPWRQIVVLPGR